MIAFILAPVLILAQSPQDGLTYPQPPPRPPVVTHPIWTATPSAGQYGAVFPMRALRMEQSGSARIRCKVNAGGGMEACFIASETPAGYEFGAAALRLAPYFRMAPKTTHGVPIAGAVVEIPVSFRLK